MVLPTTTSCFVTARPVFSIRKSTGVEPSDTLTTTTPKSPARPGMPQRSAVSLAAAAAAGRGDSSPVDAIGILARNPQLKPTAAAPRDERTRIRMISNRGIERLEAADRPGRRV
jgi:hypothetical protein